LRREDLSPPAIASSNLVDRFTRASSVIKLWIRTCHPHPPNVRWNQQPNILQKKGKLRSITGCIVASTTSASMYTIQTSVKIPLKLLELLQHQPLSLEQMTQACLRIQSWHQQVSSTTWGPLSELQHMHKSHGPTA
jgi:hypothetical protein